MFQYLYLSVCDGAGHRIVIQMYIIMNGWRMKYSWRTQLLRRPMAAPIFVHSICVQRTNGCGAVAAICTASAFVDQIRLSRTCTRSALCWKQLKPICEWSNFVLTLELMTWLGAVVAVYCVVTLNTPSTQSTDERIAIAQFLCFIYLRRCIRIDLFV